MVSHAWIGPAGMGKVEVDILAKASEHLANEPDILDISIQAGFDWSDKRYLGPSVLVTGNGETPRAQVIADELAEFAWATRGVKTIELLPVEKAMRIAKEPATGPGPLLIGDFTDCPGAAAMGDGTVLLKAMIEARLEDAVLCSIADAAAVQTAIDAGVGKTASLELGGKLDPRLGGGPLAVEAKVLVISDGVAVRKGPYFTGVATRFGPSCLIEVKGVRVIVATYRLQIDDREQFRIFGIDPDRTNILACKAVNHFRADFEPVSRNLIYVEAGGWRRATSGSSTTSMSVARYGRWTSCEHDLSRLAARARRCQVGSPCRTLAASRPWPTCLSFVLRVGRFPTYEVTGPGRHLTQREKPRKYRPPSGQHWNGYISNAQG